MSAMQLLHRTELGAFLNQIGLTGTGVEVGAADGRFAREILRTRKGQHMVLVDCWQPQDPSQYCDIANTGRTDQDAKRTAAAALAQADSRVQLLAAFTPDAATQFSDASL